MITSFVVYQNWISSIVDASMPVEIQDKIIGDFVRYGVGLPPEHADDWQVTGYVNLLKQQIDYKKNEYETRIEQGKQGGRKKQFDNKIIYDMAREGKTATQISMELGCSKSTIDKSEGWKHRKDEQFEF